MDGHATGFVMTEKEAEKWRPVLETDAPKCGSASCLGNGQDQWGIYTMTCPLWEAARLLGLTPGQGQHNLNARLSLEGKQPVLF